MGNNVSSSTLFHFMGKFEYLQQALEGKLHPRYYKEDLRPFFNLPVYIAMKCFCDIPLSLVSNHTNEYGRYAIGLSKDWGMKKGLNPVTYFNEDSDYVSAIQTSYDSNIKNFNNTEENYGEDTIYNMGKNIRYMNQSFLYSKPINGRMWRDNKWKPNVYFYNEREWRFVPPASESIYDIKNHYSTDELYFSQGKSYANNIPLDEKIQIESDALLILNEKISYEIKIDFSYSNVDFIIVQNNDEVIKLCKFIDKLNKKYEDANLLKTKIIKFSDIDKNV